MVAFGVLVAAVMQLSDISCIIGMTRCKLANLNLKTKTGASRQTFKGVMLSAKVISLVCPF